MKQSIRSVLYILAALCLLTGTILYITHWVGAAYLFGVGAAGLTLCYVTEPNEKEIRKRRLQRYNQIAGLLMIITSVFMFKQRNEWILCLSISAFLQLYVAFVFPKDRKDPE
ncbi:MAG: hypothetical protein PHG27_13345 [Massilibacteroides sp.]|nr:hypothetical protein [Massilibacteroides sp.]MDD3061780.1 hypothetical protein [Massilibacteroides sp.]MDD4116547.1 hypothetical protein [Massilibacteroides sp.]MDD4660424.1 hypothetical protein [Massilibacteroides sp.]